MNDDTNNLELECPPAFISDIEELESLVLDELGNDSDEGNQSDTEQTTSSYSDGEDELSQVSLEALASFDFENASQDSTNPDNTPLATSLEFHEDGDNLESEEEFQVQINENKFYKKPTVRLVTAALLCLSVMSLVGLMFNGASGVKIGVSTPGRTTKGQNQTEEVDEKTVELAEAKAELATSNLEKEVQQINENVASNKNKESANNAEDLSSRTVSPSSRPESPSIRVPSTPSRSVTPNRIAFPTRSTVPPVRSSPQQSNRGAGRPPSNAVISIPKQLPSPSQKSQRAAVLDKVAKADKPTFLSMGGFDDSQTSSSPTEIKIASSSGSLPANTNVQLNRELSAFMDDKGANVISVGSKFAGKTSTSAIAVSGTKFMARIEEGELQGAILIGKVDNVAGKSLSASAEKLIYFDSEYPLENVSVTGKNGSTLKAKRDRGFFSSSFGQAILGAGRGIANEATSRSETFTQFGNGGFRTSKEGGNQDLQSLAFGALEGFADPLLEAPDPENTAFLKPNTSIEIHFFQSLRIFK